VAGRVALGQCFDLASPKISILFDPCPTPRIFPELREAAHNRVAALDRVGALTPSAYTEIS